MSGAYYNEHDPKAAAWLRELIKAGHIAPGEVDERSIVEVKPHELHGFTQCHFFAGIGGWSLALRLAAWPDSRPVWTGSCPCQPFSCAGKQLAEADERHLWPAWFGIIRQCRPATLFGEQVASKAALQWLDGVCADMEGADYACGASDLCAAGVGAPQEGQRIYWMASSNGSRRERTRSPQSTQRISDSVVPWGFSPSLGSDGCTRRVNARAYGLGYGISARVVLNRGFGNAIVPQLAAEFIQACEESISLLTQTEPT